LPRTLLFSLAAAAVLAALWGLDRILLKAEARGWIYYRKKRGTSSRLGSAFLEVQSVLEPDKRHAAEVRKEKGLPGPESSAPPEPVESENPG
jgi:hypothetical protein